MRQNDPASFRRSRAITLLELMVVVLIISILATIATNVYTGQTLRAKIAATRNTIRELSVAAVRYEIDTGELPLSGSGTITPNIGGTPAITSRAPSATVNALVGVGNQRQGAGFLYLELVHSLSGDSSVPYPSTWDGPYIEFSSKIILAKDDLGNALPEGEAQILDSFGFPFEFVNSAEYLSGIFLTSHLGITGIPAYSGQGAQMWAGAKPASSQPELPANNPFAATETFYNPATFQVYSVGVNGTTYDGVAPPSDDPGSQYKGTEADDLNNYGY